MKTTKKIYGDYYAALLDSRGFVIWACGNAEWQRFYKSHPDLKYEKAYNLWSIKKDEEKPVRKVYRSKSL